MIELRLYVGNDRNSIIMISLRQSIGEWLWKWRFSSNISRIASVSSEIDGSCLRSDRAYPREVIIAQLINGRLFLDLIVFNSENLKSQSLNDLSVILKNEHDVDITKQSLHERFNESAVTFLKDALERLIRTQLDVEPYLLNLEGINRSLIKDSVCFQIDESLATDYPGSGGDGSKASVRIQFEYDLLCGKINDLSLNAFNDQEATNSVATVDLLWSIERT